MTTLSHDFLPSYVLPQILPFIRPVADAVKQQWRECWEHISKGKQLKALHIQYVASLRRRGVIISTHTNPKSTGGDREGAHALLHLMKSEMVGGLEYALTNTGKGYFGAMPLVREIPK